MDAKKKSNKYHGKLSAADITTGMNIAEQNAFRLLEDATILLNSKRYPTACSLAVLALEELGKVIILRFISIAPSDFTRVAFWKMYHRSHISKNSILFMQRLAIERARKNEDLEPVYDDANECSIALDQAKQLGFYSDCLGKSRWGVPWEKGDEKSAKGIVEFAQGLIKNVKHTEKEIELFIEHLGPWVKSRNYSNVQALENWFSALENAGIFLAEIMGLDKFQPPEE